MTCPGGTLFLAVRTTETRACWATLAKVQLGVQLNLTVKLPAFGVTHKINDSIKMVLSSRQIYMADSKDFMSLFCNLPAPEDFPSC